MKQWFSTWMTAVRPFSFTASSMPVIFGTVLAVIFGEAELNIVLFAASLVGMIILHAGANLLNDVMDYKKGLDTVPNPVSGAIVRGLITPSQGMKGVLALFAVGSAVGLWIASQVGVSILILGIIGAAIGVLYTATPAALKYHRLGDLAVFLNFGILGALGAWIVQTGSFSPLPMIWSIPLSMLVIGIVHANNWRDITSDKEGKIATVASTLGDKGSEIYYGFLVFGSFAGIVMITLITNIANTVPAMPWTFLIVLLALPIAVTLWKKGANRHTSSNPVDFLALDGGTAQLNMIFGLLCIAAALLHFGIGKAL